MCLVGGFPVNQKTKKNCDGSDIDSKESGVAYNMRLSARLVIPKEIG